jgi:uncharacterized protein YceK
MLWELFICAGITWGGCGSVTISDYSNEAACYRALAAMRVNDQSMAESDKRRSMYAFCRPKK